MGCAGSTDAKIDLEVSKPTNKTPVTLSELEKVSAKVARDEEVRRTTKIVISRWSKAAINAHKSPSGESRWPKLHKSLTNDISVAVTWMVYNDDWNIYTDEYYNPYFLCTSTGESSWIPPDYLGKLPNNLATLTVSIPSDISPGQLFTVSEGGVSILILAPYYIDNFSGMTAQLLSYYGNEVATIEVDAETAWNAFCSATNLDNVAVADSVAVAHCVLDEIAQGYFSNDLLFQISWAYKVHLLETAIKDCYLVQGDYLDSSKYDSCNGIPRYSSGGLLEWWQDLVTHRAKLIKLLASDHSRFDMEDESSSQMFNHFHQVSINFSAFNPNADMEEITRLVQRRQVLEEEIDSLVSQALAITSVTGGPTKESLETVKYFLQEHISSSSAGDQMKEIQDEIEEFVSNALQARHKFVVDILINMTLLENELDSINKTINSYELKTLDDSNVKSKDSSLAPVDSDSAGMEEAVSSLIEQSELEYKNLENALLVERDRKHEALAERLAKKRKTRIDELVNGDPPMEPEDAVKVVDEEINLEETDETLAMDKAVTETLTEFRIKSLNDIKRRSEEESARLHDNLFAEKEKRLSTLRDRLAAKKKQKSDELSGQPASVIENALIALDEELMEGVDSIEAQFNETVLSEQKSELNLLKERFDAENSRMQQALQSHGDARKRALQARLEKKVAHRANDLVNDSSNSLTVAQALSIAKAEFESEQLANDDSINLELKMALNNNTNQVLRAMKDLQVRENNNLKNELERVEEESKSKLQSRLELKRRKLENDLAASNPSTTAEEISKQVDKAMVQEEKVLLSEEASKVSKIKADLDANLNALNDDLKSKSTTSLGNLKGRLKKRNENRINEQQQTKKVHVDTLLNEIKNDTKVIVDWINRLADSQTKIISLEDRTQVQDMNERAKFLMLYTTIKDNLSAGYKKSILYYIKAIKELASGTPDGMLSADQVHKIQSPEFRDKCVLEAYNNILTRYKRDVDGTMESQLNERMSSILKLFDSKTSVKKIIDSDMKVSEQHLDGIRSDLYKNIATIAGLYIVVPDILEVAVDVSAKYEEDDLLLEDSDVPQTFGNKIIEWFKLIVASMKVVDASSTWLHYIYFGNHANILCKCNYNVNIASYSYLVKAKIIKALIPIYLLLLQHCYSGKASLTSLTQDVTNSNSVFAKQMKDIYKANFEAEVTNTLQALVTDSKYLTAELTDVIHDYSNIIDEYLSSPHKSLRDTYSTVLQSIGAKGWNVSASLSASPGSSSNQAAINNMHSEAKQRENELLKSLDEKMEKKKKELAERLARRDKNKSIIGSKNDTEATFKELNDAFDQVKSMVMSASSTNIIDDINVDGLMKAIELKVTGELTTISSESLLKVQQVMEQKEEQSMVQKVLQQHSESAEALDVSLKVKKAKESQALKERLKRRKQAN